MALACGHTRSNAARARFDRGGRREDCTESSAVRTRSATSERGHRSEGLSATSHRGIDVSPANIQAPITSPTPSAIASRQSPERAGSHTSCTISLPTAKARPTTHIHRPAPPHRQVKATPANKIAWITLSAPAKGGAPPDRGLNNTTVTATSHTVAATLPHPWRSRSGTFTVAEGATDSIRGLNGLRPRLHTV